MSTKAQRLKNVIDTVVCDVTTRYRGLLMKKLQQRKRKMERHLSCIQNYEDRYEQSANQVVQFLVFIKTSHVPQIKDSPNLSQHLLLSLVEEFNMVDVNQLLRRIPKIQMLAGKRQVGIDECVKLMSTPLQHTSVCVAGYNGVWHISLVNSDRVWISDGENLILTDTTGDTIHNMTGIPNQEYGVYTVNSRGELIYIDRDYNINKLSTDNTTVTTLLEYTSPWWPQCVYCSPTTGHLMVGMCDRNTETGKVTLYSYQPNGVLTIQHRITGHMLYRDPCYITENRNSDIIVSDVDRVVVTERRGKHRFSYTGPPSGSRLSPYGICTDALSHILVCDYNTDTVQMIDKDGHFLSLFLTSQNGIYEPRSICHDDKTHLLWVGSWENNRVCVYRHTQRRYPMTGKCQLHLVYCTMCLFQEIFKDCLQ
jgi:hypothetical protein